MTKWQEYLPLYKQQLAETPLQKTYCSLLHYVRELAAFYAKATTQHYSIGNVSPGYMDFTYFPLVNDFLKARKLRFGIVLNHKELCFELRLMG